MSLSLFAHNREAYETALAMLHTAGKAAVIHPTGTGKSFIAFQLCEAHPDKTVCWLSPSEYIFKTQVENLRRVADGYVPENIRFFTYAKLMRMEAEELSLIQPDYIVLDEFHRCGAEMWGEGVARLLTGYPAVPLLGLSATAIRYLDNQRDMSDELFDGHVASEMTLGEAILRGILQPPTYVQTVFSYQQHLDVYSKRIRRAKNALVRDKAEQYLEALRRRLDQADGLDVIFDKYMTDRRGKYLVFCANGEHMGEMIRRVPEWFHKVDEAPHVYSAYSDDPETNEAFRDFKADTSNHLKLLFCIDMLNEGVHVEDVSGVILFRPTVSPIIYKQQIGRALSTGGSRSPIIFDIVNNIENLYSIGTVQEEMRAAMTYYRFLGEGEEIVNERFSVIDELKDCRELFERLNETLTSSWDSMYDLARVFYEQHGHLKVPQRYKTAEGYSLGNWVQTQKNVRSGKQYGNLSDERVAKLDAIGMVWEGIRDSRWNRLFAAARQFAADHGHLDVDAGYVTNEGLALGRWISQIRTYRKSGIQTAYLTPERIRALDGIGMIWSVPDYLWESNCADAESYYREHGHLNVPLHHIGASGRKLGVWIANQRARRRDPGKYAGTPLTKPQIDRLDAIGMIWDKRADVQWEKGYAEAKAYAAQYGHLDVPVTFVTEEGYRLGRWISRQRTADAAKLSPNRKARLEKLGMTWNEDSWETRYRLAEAYYREHGHLRVPGNYIAEGIWLNKWLNEQKQIYLGKRQGKTLADTQIRRLEAIGMQWQTSRTLSPVTETAI